LNDPLFCDLIPRLKNPVRDGSVAVSYRSIPVIIR
jgi:hypothetical protein